MGGRVSPLPPVLINSSSWEQENKLITMAVRADSPCNLQGLSWVAVAGPGLLGLSGGRGGTLAWSTEAHSEVSAAVLSRGGI